MPKQFGRAVSVFVTLAVMTSLVGCRTASNQLASVPGFGWLNRGDEGWAKYEPAPSLPRPSSTSEPTGMTPPAANIASNEPSTSSELGSSTRGYDTATSATGDLASKNRFSERYMPKAGASDAGNKYGDYASAYGKYGPPKSLEAASDKTQQGPYGSDLPKYQPKYASNAAADAVKGYDTSTSYNSLAGSKYVSPSSSKPAEETPAKEAATEPSPSPYGYVANSRFDAGTSASTAKSTPEAKFAADTSGGSRFGEPKFSNSASTTPPATYTPPGFASTTPKKPLGSKFGDIAANAQQQANSFANSAKGQLASATNSTIEEGKKFAGGLTNNAKNSVGNFAANAQAKVTSTVDSATNGLNPPGQFNRYADANKSFVNETLNSASQTANSLANGADNGVKKLSNGAAEITNKFASGFNNQVASSTANAQAKAQQFANNVANSAPGTPAPGTPASGTTGYPTTGAANPVAATADAAAARFGSYAQSAKDQLATATNSSLNSAASTANTTFNNAAAQANNFAQGTLQNATSGLAAKTEKASQYANDTLNRFTDDATAAAKNVATNVQQQATGQVQSLATQAQQNLEQTVTSTYNQAKTNFEQTAASQYEQAKSTVGQYANSAVESAKSTASELANGVTQNDTYKAATTKASEYLNAAGNAVSQTVNNTGQTLQNYGNSAVEAGRTAMQNVSAPIAAYPTTSTPNPFVVPGNSVSASREIPPATATPGTFQPYEAPATNTAPGPVHRTATPFLPGSTKSFKGATTTRKPSVELASATKDAVEDVAATTVRDDQLVLAVGDKYQFPTTLR